MKYRGSISNI